MIYLTNGNAIVQKAGMSAQAVFGMVDFDDARTLRGSDCCQGEGESCSCSCSCSK